MKIRYDMKRLLAFFLCLAILFSCLPHIPFAANAEASSFAVHFIDVGQADAALVLCDGKAMLIDGGNAADSNIMYTYLRDLGVNHLDYVIGTHAHEDHIGGIPGALRYATAGVVYCPVTSYVTDAFDTFVAAVQRRGLQIQIPTIGTEFSLGSASCRIIAVNIDDEDINNTSIVMRIVYGETSFLFTGDAELEVENYLVESGETLKSTVLKVGHHGSYSSTSYRFLREVMPQYAMIGVGADNTYGHPTEGVLSRLRDADVKCFRTDMQGDIVCVSDGEDVTFTVDRNADADTYIEVGGNSTQKPSENAPEDPLQIVDEAYQLAANERLPYIAQLTGKVIRIDQEYNDYYGNVTLTMAVPGREDKPIRCFRLEGVGVSRIGVGDTVTVTGSILNYQYNSGATEVEFEAGCVLTDYILASDTQEPVVPEGEQPLETTYVRSVQVGAPYKLASDCKGTKYYFNGKTDSVSYRLGSTTDPEQAVDVYLEQVSGGYRLYFMDGSQKTYIRLYEYSDGTAGKGGGSLQLTTARPAEVMTFDPDLCTLMYRADADNTYHFGCYNSYTTFRASNNYYVTGSNASKVDVSQFPARLYQKQPLRNGRVESWGVTLGQQIALVFNMEYTEAVLADEDAYVQIQVAGQTQRIPVSQAPVTVKLAAAQMNSPVTVCVVAGDGSRGVEKSYTVRQYADYILQGGYDDETEALLKAMLSYGGKAQQYFDYETDTPADQNIAVAPVQLPAKAQNELTITGQAAGIESYGATMRYLDKLAIRFYFDTDSVGQYTFTVNGESASATQTQSQYWVQQQGIAPWQLETAVTVTVTDPDNQVLRVVYSPMNYILRVYKRTDNGQLKALLQALYGYALAAKAYLEK